MNNNLSVYSILWPNFKRETGLTHHQLRVHPNDFPDIPWIQCTHNGCQYKTKCKPAFTDHMKTHTKPYVCSECQKGFGASDDLKRHKRTHNKDLKIRCEWYGCEATVQQYTALKMHMNTHTGNTVYRCQWAGCDKSYLNQTTLATHKRRQHDGIADHQCYWPECDYKTTNWW